MKQRLFFIKVTILSMFFITKTYALGSPLLPDGSLSMSVENCSHEESFIQYTCTKNTVSNYIFPPIRYEDLIQNTIKIPDSGGASPSSSTGDNGSALDESKNSSTSTSTPPNLT